MDRGAWWPAVHRVARSWTWLSDFTFTFRFHALEREMATHSSWESRRVPGMAEPGGLLNFVKGFFDNYWDDHIVFIFQFVHMVYTLIDLCILKTPCIPGINPTWSSCMSFLMCCLILFAEDFCIYVHQWYCPIVFFFVLSLSGFNIRVTVAS